MKHLKTILFGLLIALSFGAYADNITNESSNAKFEANQQITLDGYSTADKNIQLAGSCCRICTTGKACGNSCISRNKTCHQYGGCACNGNTVELPLNDTAQE